MLRLLSSKAQGRKDFWKPSKPCHVGIHWIALAEYSQMSTHVPGFQSFFIFFCIILYWPNSLWIKASFWGHYQKYDRSETMLVKQISRHEPSCCWWLIWSLQNDAKIHEKLLKTWHMGTHMRVLSECNMTEGFQKLLHLCASDKSHLSIGRVIKTLLFTFMPCMAMCPIVVFQHV